MQSEFSFISRIREWAARQSGSQAGSQAGADLVLGIGDDAAVLREQTGRETLVTVDLLIEDVDFRLEYARPQWLGHKALAVSLSDIAAMGGTPKFSLLTLAIPGKSGPAMLKSESFWEEFFAGYFALAGKYGVNLLGGDISATPGQLAIDSFVIGHCSAGAVIRRSGARVGDAIYLTGNLGASAAGLRLLSQGARVDEIEEGLLQNALRAHLKPEPHVDFGRRIGNLGLAHAMIDVSDGLAQDLSHICAESNVAAIIDFETVPIAAEVQLVVDSPEAAFSFAISGGEDFGQLLTASKENENKLLSVAESCSLKLTRIGEIIEAGGDSSHLLVRNQTDIKPLLARGYDHFLD
jgi:thiamine-monophosphate kinase